VADPDIRLWMGPGNLTCFSVWHVNLFRLRGESITQLDESQGRISSLDPPLVMIEVTKTKRQTN